MRIAVIGTGAMGSLFAARLSPLADVRVFGHWAEQLVALRSQDLKLIELDGSENLQPVRVADLTRHYAPFNFALVLVKSWQTQNAGKMVAQILNETSLVITLQNGLGNREILAESVGSTRTVQGVTSEGATMLGPGSVRHAGKGLTYLAFEPLTEERLTRLAKLLGSAGFETHLIANPEGLIWGKLAVNAGINPLTALLQVPNGFLAVNPIARKLMIQAARETEQVAQALKIKLPYDSAADQVVQVALATATNRSSMAQDIARGAQTEIDSICGQIIQHGQKTKTPTSVNEVLLNLIKAKVNSKAWRPEIDHLPQELKSDFHELLNDVTQESKC